MIFKVKGQGLEVVGNVIAEGAVEFASFTLECDGRWDGYSRTVRFRRASSDTVYDVAGVVDGRVYYIPSEVLVRGSVYVSVLGVMGEERISTTEFAGFFVEGTLASGKTPSVTPDAYAQYVSLVNEKCEDITEKSAIMEESCKTSVSASLSAKESEKSCRNSVQTCNEYAEECTRIARSVSGAEDMMQSAVESVRDSVTSLLSREHEISVAENERASSENLRRAFEDDRRVRELEREERENERVLSEAERVAAERGRVAGEVARDNRVEAVEKELGAVSKTLVYKAPAIFGEMEGESVVIDDASQMPPIKLLLKGASPDLVGSRENPVSLFGTKKVTLTFRGKNMIPYPYYSALYSNNGVLYEVSEDGGVSISGATSSSKSYFEITNSSFILGEGHYVVSGGSEKCGVFVYDYANGNYIARSNGGDAEFTVETERRFGVRIYIYAGSVVDEKLYPMLRLFSTNSDYEKWYEKTESLSLPRELFSVPNAFDTLILSEHGGLPRMELKLARYTFDGSELPYVAGEDNGYRVFRFDTLNSVPAKAIVGDALSRSGRASHMPYSNTEGECCWAEGESIYMKLNASEFPDSASVSAFLVREGVGGSPVEVIYTRSTSVIEELSEGIAVELNGGVNMISCNKGEIRINYVRDTNAVFESIIETLLSLDARVSLLEV